MNILGFMGSPRLKGLCAQFTQSALEGAAGAGAAIRRYDLIRCHIKFCRGCHTCVYENHELPIGRCPLKDDMAGILEEYLQADGYVFACPVYDMSVTAVMKSFIERRFPLFYKDKNAHGRLPDARVKQGFKKKAVLLATGDAAEEYAEAIAEPCFELMSGHLMIEEIDVVEKLYVGHIYKVGPQRLEELLEKTRGLGARLVEEIRKARA